MILAIIVTEFPEAAERARAMSAYVFVSVAGGSLGLLAGGLLTEALSWHWVFFVNLPIGVATFALGRALIRADRGLGLEHGVDWLGSLLVTASLMSAIYAIVEATTHGWTSPHVLGMGALAAVLMAAFLALEARIENPIMPLRILRAARAGQREPRPRLPRHRDVLDVLPRHALPRARPPLQRAADRRGVPALDAHRRGRSRRAITARLVDALRAASACSRRAWRAPSPGCSCSPPSGRTPRTSRRSSSPASLIGLGIGNAFMPLLTLAMADVPAADAGLGSGITNVSQQISGALGLAVLSTIAANHTKGLLSDGHGARPAR